MNSNCIGAVACSTLASAVLALLPPAATAASGEGSRCADRLADSVKLHLADVSVSAAAQSAGTLLRRKVDGRAASDARVSVITDCPVSRLEGYELINSALRKKGWQLTQVRGTEDLRVTSFGANDEIAPTPTALSSAGSDPTNTRFYVQTSSLDGVDRVFVSTEIGGRVVKGAPYSATAVSETTQTLADGNRISRKSETKLVRDGEGRTRQERSDGSIYLSDPVAGKNWLLRPKTKSAIELPRAIRVSERGPAAAPMAPAAPVPPVPPVPPLPRAPGAAPPAPPPPAANASDEEMRSWAESMRAWARDFAARFRSEETKAAKEAGQTAERGSTRIVSSLQSPRVEVHTTTGSDGSVTRDVRVDVVSVGDGPVPLPPLPPGAPLMPGFGALPMMAPMGEGVTTSLGSREFDGVRADGTRTTWTIAAGKIGNEKPIEILSERWHAPDLMLVVQTRYFDPRSGENTYRLAQLKRGEPDAALFKVPADYEVRNRAEDRKREREMREEKR
jgi:hypothetical protein